MTTTSLPRGAAPSGTAGTWHTWPLWAGGKRLLPRTHPGARPPRKRPAAPTAGGALIVPQDPAGRYPVRAVRIEPDATFTVTGWPLFTGDSDAQRRHAETLSILGLRPLPLAHGLCAWVQRDHTKLAGRVNAPATALARELGCRETLLGTVVITGVTPFLTPRTLTAAQLTALEVRLSAGRAPSAAPVSPG